MKLCTKCNKAPAIKKGSWCLLCRAASSREWRKSNPEKQRLASRRWEKEHPEQHKAYKARAKRKQRYGITEVEYQELVKVQKGLCAICSNPLKVFHVDHCHESNKIRGLLCNPCNSGMGMLGDSIPRLEAAIRYLGR